MVIYDVLSTFAGHFIYMCRCAFFKIYIIISIFISNTDGCSIEKVKPSFAASLIENNRQALFQN